RHRTADGPGGLTRAPDRSRRAGRRRLRDGRHAHRLHRGLPGHHPRAGGLTMSPLRLRRPSVRTFAGSGRPAPTAAELEYMTDFLAEFGTAPDLELYAGGGGNSFTRMCGALLSGPDGARRRR